MKEFTPVLGKLEVPARVEVKAFDQPTFGSHLVREVGTAAEDFPEDFPSLLMRQKGTFDCMSSVLAKLVEAHVHRLDQLVRDVAAYRRRIIIREVILGDLLGGSLIALLIRT